MKKMSKILSIVMIAVIIISLGTSVFAVVDGVQAPDKYKGKAVSGTEKITNLGNQAITVLTTFAVVVSIIVLIVLGIKYMMGSAEEKAEYKKTMMPYVIGAALVFAAGTIANILYGFLTNIN